MKLKHSWMTFATFNYTLDCKSWKSLNSSLRECWSFIFAKVVQNWVDSGLSYTGFSVKAPQCDQLCELFLCTLLYFTLPTQVASMYSVLFTTYIRHSKGFHQWAVASNLPILKAFASIILALVTPPFENHCSRFHSRPRQGLFQKQVICGCQVTPWLLLNACFYYDEWICESSLTRSSLECIVWPHFSIEHVASPLVCGSIDLS